MGSKLLQYLGYHVVPSPRTGQEDLDPLLINAPDLYAEGEGRGFAVNVQSAGDHVTTNFDYVDNLTASAWALSKFSQEKGDGEIRSVESAVLLLGTAEDPVILLHRRRGDLRVVKLTREQAAALEKAASEEEVRDLLESCRLQLEAPLDRVAAG